jgi:hypothetical protein
LPYYKVIHFLQLQKKSHIVMRFENKLNTHFLLCTTFTLKFIFVDQQCSNEKDWIGLGLTAQQYFSNFEPPQKSRGQIQSDFGGYHLVLERASVEITSTPDISWLRFIRTTGSTVPESPRFDRPRNYSQKNTQSQVRFVARLTSQLGHSADLV